MPYLDPKVYDDGAYEIAKYAERRDDIGRLMLSVMMQARGELASKESAGQ
jgi:arsenate reductase